MPIRNFKASSEKRLQTTIVTFTPIWTAHGSNFKYDIVLPETVNLSETLFKYRVGGYVDAAWNGAAFHALDENTVRVVSSANSTTRERHIEVVQGLNYVQHFLSTQSTDGNKTETIASVPDWDAGDINIDINIRGARNTFGSASGYAFQVDNCRLTAATTLEFYHNQYSGTLCEIPFQIYRY